MDKEMEIAVQSQLKHYPESTLIDIYKSFFQDRFGPGHLIEDTAASREYFDEELAKMNSRGRHLPEPCGLGEQFYRVPLDLVKDGRLEADVFFGIFLDGAKSFKSAGDIDKAEIEAWKESWRKIVVVVESMDLNLPGFEADKAVIEEMLGRGKIVAHHSPKYIETYDPHYRIISKEQLDKLDF